MDVTRLSSLLLLAGLSFTARPGGGLLAGEDGPLVPLPAVENGDTNGDWSVDLSDVVYLLDHLFLGGPQPVPILCELEVAEILNGDANGDGRLDVSDAIGILGYLYLGRPAPTHACGLEGSHARPSQVATSMLMVYDRGGSPPKRQWIDAAGVLHQRDAVGLATVSGEAAGTARTVDSLNVDPATGEGELFGSFLLEVTWQGRTGTWDGRYSGPISGGVGFGRFVGRGHGGLEGTRIRGTFEQTGFQPDVFALEAVVIGDP